MLAYVEKEVPQPNEPKLSVKMWGLVEHHVPDFVRVAWPNITQIVWCWSCMQFSQVIFVLILESTKALILQNYYVCVFLYPSPANAPILYPMKTSVISKRGTEMENWLKIG